MSILKDMIATRLEERQLFSLEIDRLIKDVSNILGTETDLGHADLNKGLRSLGWEENVLDYRTLELIAVFLDNEPEVEINHSGP